MSAAITLLGGANAVYAATYSGTVYSGTKYGGTVLEPVYYNGVALRPISYGGTVIEGVVYSGIDLKHHKVTVHTITGNETSDDFFDSAVPEEYRIDWKKVIGKFAIGTTIIVLTGIVSSFVPGASGFIAATATTSKGAVSFAALNSIIEATLAYFEGKPKKAIFKKAVEGAADGFMWGAMTAAVAYGAISLSKLKKLKPLLNSKRKSSYFLDEPTGIVYGRDGKEAGKLMAAMNEKGEYKYFYDKNGRLVNFDGKIIANKPRMDGRKIIDKISRKNHQEIGYVDYKGVLHEGEANIKKAIELDKLAQAKGIKKASLRDIKPAVKKLTPEEMFAKANRIETKKGKLFGYQYKGTLLSESKEIIGTIRSGIVRDNSGKVIGYFSRDKGLLTSRRAINKAIKKEWEPVKNNYCHSRKIKGENVKLGEKGSGPILGENVEACYGIELPKYSQAHHIFPKAIEGEYGEKIRAILEKHNIDINDCANGIPLPSDEYIGRILGLPVHSGPVDALHGPKYLEYVYKELSKKDTKENVMNVMNGIKKSICHNKKPWLK